jgi:tripartite-type tricarboxylate transporter receptor subunit TctC
LLQSPVRSLALAALSLAAVFANASGQPARADEYPSRQITLIVPSPPGGGTDTQARILAPKLSEILGQTIIIENRGGAAGGIGAQTVAKAAPDGYTLLAMISSHAINPSVLKKVPYDIDRDFTMISRTVVADGVLVGHPSLPAKNLKELLTYLKENPGKLSYGSAGIGSLSHLIMQQFEQQTGVNLLHVPYRGTQPALNGVLADEVKLMIPDLTIALGQIQSGYVRAFGVTSDTRSETAPDIPTVAEAGLPGFKAVQWFGLAAPARTPPPIVRKLFEATVKALNDPDVKAHYAKLAMVPDPSASPEDYAKFVRDETVRWANVVKDAHIEPQ